MTPQERHPTGICPGAPSEHLPLWPANHRLQKVCICWRTSNHACWWRLAGSGRGADQVHGNCRWIPPDLEAKAQHYKTVLAAFHLNNKEAKHELKANFNNETLPFCSKPRYLGVTLDRSLTYCRHLESLRKKLTSRVASWGGLLARLGCWSNNSTNSHPSPGALNRRVLCSCLVTTPCELWLDACVLHQRTTFQPSQHPNCWAELRRIGATRSLSRLAMEPGYLLHSPLTRPSSANARHLKSRHPFLPAAQHLTSISDKTTYVRRTGRITNGMRRGRTAPQDSAFSSPTPVTTLLEWPSQEEPGSGLTASAPVSDVSALVCTNGVWPHLRWSVCDPVVFAHL